MFIEIQVNQNIMFLTKSDTQMYISIDSLNHDKKVLSIWQRTVEKIRVLSKDGVNRDIEDQLEHLLKIMFRARKKIF